ncbi:MAG: hypothetical protein A2806_02695 [Candidatus Terrybacteria bacterium RIFCSPHIGHO2_01_FULL_48_17]|uniref:Class II aldolase/adducin N-terminal domain-containing protein n=1 Tax=Candidatus Terrybacteria bacterium RIFCSPHIGHO2_01_FULL_48_17 TaxID=1802362 RepID=A0A1G2PI43_9BACT|nr:MAG: hypothetical protein A2806_02695 [Candidatus Terrybacteria bacterium RIFCSPHIGHO2_01_FULL_48_17]
MSVVKFRTIFRGSNPRGTPYVEEAIFSCREAKRRGLAPGTSGNVSVRTPRGFLISVANTALGTIKQNEFVEVVGLERTPLELVVYVYGKQEPSSETPLHWAIYQARPDVGAILHLHDDFVRSVPAYFLDIPFTWTQQQSGTWALVQEVLFLLRQHPNAQYFILQGHGVVSTGKTAEAAIKQAVKIHRKANRYKRQEKK